MDWSRLSSYWASLYGKTGKPSHPPLVAFKMLLLQHWFNGLSDEEVEWQCRDPLSFRKFLGVSTAEAIPDSTTLVRFRSRLLKAGVTRPIRRRTGRGRAARCWRMVTRPTWRWMRAANWCGRSR